MSQNREDNTLATAAAFVCAGLLMIGAVIAIGLCFLAFLLTIVCTGVWLVEKPLTLGTITITPDEARTFILRGVAGEIGRAHV